MCQWSIVSSTGNHHITIRHQDVAPGTNCKNREFVLAGECSAVNCPTELPDWGSGTGGWSGSEGGDGDSDESAGIDTSTNQYRLNTTHHGK